MNAYNDDSENDLTQKILTNVTKLYGYDIDCNITKVALVNIRLKVLAILSRENQEVSFKLWDQIRPNIYKSSLPDNICGALSTDNRIVVNILNGNETGIDFALGNADIVLTNPPYATIKGMLPKQKDFMKKKTIPMQIVICAYLF